MRARPNPKPFFNFSTRLDSETNERRYRLEKAYRQSAPQMLAEVFRTFENDLLKGLNERDRQAYLAGAFDCSGRR